MKMKIISKVQIDGVGICTDEYIHEFDDDSNVFGRILEYHQRMYKVFPNCEFRLISAEVVE